MADLKKGNVPWNKGMKGLQLSPHSQFKKGQFVGENHPSWKGGIQHNEKDCKYIHTGAGKRKRHPRYVWEQVYGELPKGYVIFHKDGDKDNDHIDNLEAITRSELMARNRKDRQAKNG